MCIIENKYNMFVVLSSYIGVSVLVAIFYSCSSSDQEKKSSFKYYFFSSFIAILLAPLILKSIGNDILEKFAGEDNYQYILMIGYIVLIALGGVPLIRKVIISHFGDDVAQKIGEIGSEVKELEKVQVGLVKNMDIDAENKFKISELCSLIDKNSGYIEIKNVPKNLEDASNVALSKTLIVKNSDDTKYKLTALGKMYCAK